jgi:methylmalonyl-CoA mutase
VRSTEEEKREQIRNLRAFQEAHRADSGPALKRLRDQALGGGNLFDELMEAVRVSSLGQIMETLYEAGGRYRRSL